MKNTIRLFSLALIISFVFANKNSVAQTPATKTESFKVYGNCEMCQDRIEGALKKKDGVLKRSWNDDTKILTVTYDPAKITLTQIKQKIADEGYDTDEIKAKDEAYGKLSKCCQYKRAKS
ncbi:MAG: heavy-metal-associated domain-containing protein [Bacteroidia bacterium]